MCPRFGFSFRGYMRTYPRSSFRSGGTSECTLVPVFVPGEHPPKPRFLKPPISEAPLNKGRLGPPQLDWYITNDNIRGMNKDKEHHQHDYRKVSFPQKTSQNGRTVCHWSRDSGRHNQVLVDKRVSSEGVCPIWICPSRCAFLSSLGFLGYCRGVSELFRGFPVFFVPRPRPIRKWAAHHGLSGPISHDIAILSLRYPISRSTFSGGRQLPKTVRYPPLVLSFRQTHLRDTPFCNISRYNCAMPHQNKHQRVL